MAKLLNRPVRAEVLGERLDALVATFDISTISPDPLELVLRYSEPRDQEIAGLIAAAFAYGRADIVVRNAGWILDRMEPGPFEYLRTFDEAEAKRRFVGFAHRFHKTPELVELLTCLAGTVQTYGSLGGLFRECYVDADPDIGPTLTRFIDAIRRASVPPAVAGRPARRPRDGDRARRPITAGGTPALLTSPRDKSACKRMNLFLRWMVRRTPPDLGIWGFVDPAKLVVPLDTHIHRITTFLGLNRRKSADWKSARAITDRLARFDAADPVRYDFAICRLGILDRCSRKRRKENCDVCLLRDVCRFPVR